MAEKIQYTAAQQDAINYRGGSVIVSAGAGSGKTKVLTERLMKYILDDSSPKSLDSFVIITFTQAAATELKQKISTALDEAVKSNPDKSKYLKKQQMLLDRTEIGTIHHFCSNIIRRNYQNAHVNPDFKIISEERAADMKENAITKVFENRYLDMAKYPGFEELVNTVGIGRNDELLLDVTKQLHEKMQCHAFPEMWAKGIIEQLHADIQDAGQTVWGQEILKSAAEECEKWSEEMKTIEFLLEEDSVLCKAYLPSISATQEAISAYIRCLKQGWDVSVKAPIIDFPKLGSCRKCEDPELAETVKEKRNACKKALQKVQGTISISSEELAEEMKATAKTMEALLQLTLDYDAAYTEDKRRHNYLDYSDLEHIAAKLIFEGKENTEYTEIMVDEYQDVSEVQDAIFFGVSDSGKKLFVVGDIKQSIYRFRLADPEIFKRKFSDQNVHKILLRENFRSRRNIIDGINSIFEVIMTESLGDTNYKENNLIYGNMYDDDGEKPQIILVESNEDEDKITTEARYVAQEIEKLHTGGSKYGDIAILLRATSKSGEIFTKVLTEYSIPVSSSNCEGFFEMTEISALISLLRVIDNPHNDIPLIATLSSAFFGFSPDELSEIRACNFNTDLYSALVQRSEIDTKCKSFIEFVDELRRIAPDLNADDLIRKILNKTDAEAICALSSTGIVKMENLMQLIALAAKFENDGYHGLHKFLKYLDRLKEKKSEILPTSNTSGAVRIMSVHKSKGLEFDTVFVCDAAHQFNISDRTSTVLVHPVLGLGPKITDEKNHTQYPTLARNAISMRIKRETLSEEMRLMYVALTRAKKRLYITACVDNPEDVVLKAFSKAPMDATCPLNWFLFAGTVTPQIVKASDSTGEEKVNCKEPELKQASEEMVKVLAKKYAYRDSAALPSKINATEVKCYTETDDEDGVYIVPRRTKKRRQLSEETALTAAERGTATHLCLQLMDFSKDANEEIDRLERELYITSRQAKAVNRDSIKKFLQSDTGKLISASEHVRREFEFAILVNAKELLNRDVDEEILLQGIVDCCIEEDDGIIVIDYKTDATANADEIMQRVETYRPQVKTYAMALERIFSKPVKRTILYFLTAEKEIVL